MSDLHTLLRLMQAQRPGTWLDEVAIAVAAVGGQEARDQLLASLTAPVEPVEPPGNPEQALAELEVALSRQPAEPAPAPVVPVDPPAPPLPPSPGLGPVPPPRRSMGD